MCAIDLTRKTKAAFTLVELLVVVAIIALLLSILLPSLASARESAKSAKCMTNLRDQVTACYSYAQDDDKDNLVPLHPRFTTGFGGGVDSQGAWINAARKTYGGKSGRHDYLETKRPGSPWPDTTMEGRYATGNGMGPSSRPLNKYLYKGGSSNKMGQALEVMRKDEQLDFSYFSCPSDTGNEGDEGRIYLGLGIDYEDRDSFYNTMGNSYSTDSILLGVPPNGSLSAIGPWLRPYAQIPKPDRVTLIKETKGFYASGWNGIPASGGSNLIDPEYFARGNHGTLRQHNVGFSDGHAQPVLFDVRTDVFSVSEEQIIHSGEFLKRGGWLEQVDVPPPHSLNSLKHLLYSGPDWADHCFPAPSVETGLHL